MDNLQVNYLGEAPTTTTTTTQLTSTSDDKSTPQEDKAQNVQSISHSKTTDVILGIFMPLIIISIAGLAFFYWKRSKKIIRLLKANQQYASGAAEAQVKFSKGTSEILVFDKNKRQSKSSDRQSFIGGFED